MPNGSSSDPARKALQGTVALLCLALSGCTAHHTYVAGIESNSAILAWGKTGSLGNTIGRGSRTIENVRVEIDGRALPEPSQNCVRVEGLEPDHEYGYVISRSGQIIGQGSFRTHPDQAARLSFFVLGDWGDGSPGQYAVAQAMAKVYEQHRRTDDPVRFVITTGDNIYARRRLRTGSGNRDRHWRKKFYSPYGAILGSIPFYPSPGNHDGRETEKPRDFDVYLDNFNLGDQIGPDCPTRGEVTARHTSYYSFSFGNLARFFALDSTRNQRPSAFEPGGEQDQWITRELESSEASEPLWKIAYFHHPFYAAGPQYMGSDIRNTYRHWQELFAQGRVRAAFNGHEHNFQASEEAEGTFYFVTGAGGRLRSQALSNMESERISCWARVHHFLLVRINNNTMEVQPYGTDGQPLTVTCRDASQEPLPTIQAREMGGE